MLDRFELLVGKENVDKLKKKTVLIKSLYELDYNEVANLLKQAGYDSTLIK